MSAHRVCDFGIVAEPLLARREEAEQSLDLWASMKVHVRHDPAGNDPRSVDRMDRHEVISTLSVMDGQEPDARPRRDGFLHR